MPNGDEAKFCFYDKERDSVEIYHSEFETDVGSMTDTKTRKLIETAKIKTYSAILKIFFEQDLPFIVIGPSGSGKRWGFHHEAFPWDLTLIYFFHFSLLLQSIMDDMSGYELTTINCSAQLTATYVLHILKQSALVISGNRGREYKPKLSKMVLFFKNIDLCYTDEWGTCQVIELILQLIQRKGFYADTLEWIGVSGLQICSSMCDIPKQRLSPRYLSVVQNFITEYVPIRSLRCLKAMSWLFVFRSPSDVELHGIIKHQILPVFMRFKHSFNKMQIDNIVSSIIEFYSNVRSLIFAGIYIIWRVSFKMLSFQIKSQFTKEIRNHYNFTPKMLSNLIEGLNYYPEDSLQEVIISIKFSFESFQNFVLNFRPFIMKWLTFSGTDWSQKNTGEASIKSSRRHVAVYSMWTQWIAIPSRMVVVHWTVYWRKTGPSKFSEALKYAVSITLRVCGRGWWFNFLGRHRRCAFRSDCHPADALYNCISMPSFVSTWNQSRHFRISWMWKIRSIAHSNDNFESENRISVAGQELFDGRFLQWFENSENWEVARTRRSPNLMTHRFRLCNRQP